MTFSISQPVLCINDRIIHGYGDENLPIRGKVTQSRLKEIIHYNPETGQFTWLVATSPRVKVGDIAGSDNGVGYLKIRVDNNSYLAHRLAWFWMTGLWPIGDIDHCDMNKSHNAWENLREATQSQNMANIAARRNNTSGFKGVYLVTTTTRWQARITLDGKNVSIGTFATKEEAALAYNRAALEYHGEYARLNNVIAVGESR